MDNKVPALIAAGFLGALLSQVLTVGFWFPILMPLSAIVMVLLVLTVVGTAVCLIGDELNKR